MSRRLYGQSCTTTSGRTRPERAGLSERNAPRIRVTDYGRVLALNGDWPWSYANAMSTVLHELTNFTQLWEPAKHSHHNQRLRRDMHQRISEKYHWLADEEAFKAAFEVYEAVAA